MRQAIRVIRIGLVRGHIQRGLGMCRSPADPLPSMNGRTTPTAAQSQKHDPPDIRCALAEQRREQLRVGRALAPPNPLAVLPDRDCRLFHGDVQTDILFHGCPPFDAWARADREPVIHPIKGQSAARGSNVAATSEVATAPAITSCSCKGCFAVVSDQAVASAFGKGQSCLNGRNGGAKRTGLSQVACGRVERTTDDTATCGVLLPPCRTRGCQ